jgi:hypothetical protein
VSIYRITRPLTAYAVKEKRALTIPAGSLVKKENYVPAVGVTDIDWAHKIVTVAVQDFLQRIEPFAPLE